ncbi:MAG: hypothetical protein ACTSQ4_12085 [Candidatus Heimdallarchaeaceae archaeon]
MTNDETENKPIKFLSSIKEIEIPWKEFISPNLLFLLIWISFLLYSLIWAPVDQTGLGFSNFTLSNVGPISWSLFNLVGAITLLYVPILFLESRERFIPAWPFVLAAIGLGMYALMPYFAFRGVWKKKPKTKKTWFTKIIDSRSLGIILHELTLGLLLFGIIAGSMNGDWNNYVTLFMESKFVHVMTIDFSLLCLFYPIVIWDDMKRRNNISDSQTKVRRSGNWEIFLIFFMLLVYRLNLNL